MADGTPAARAGINRWLRPRYVIPAVFIIVVIAIIGAPTGQDQTAELTTRSFGPRAASGLLQVAERLGWRTEQRRSPLHAPLDSTAVYAVLDVPRRLDDAEVVALLDAVRRGAGLLWDPSADSSSLNDSLGIIATSSRLLDSTDTPATASGWPSADDLDLGTLTSYVRPPSRDTTDTIPQSRSFPESVVPIVTARYGGRAWKGQVAVVTAQRLGRGRVVVVADDILLQNDNLSDEDADAGVFYVRLLEWLRPAGMPLEQAPARLVFDEYHHGATGVPIGMDAVVDWLVTSAAGRVLLQLAVAGMLLVVASAPRAIPPEPRPIIERRSPLEHVGALSRAYAQIGATRLSTRRLVRGLQRRHPISGSASADEASYLRLLAARHPAVRDDVARLDNALNQKLPSNEFARLGETIDHIERTIAP